MLSVYSGVHTTMLCRVGMLDGRRVALDSEAGGPGLDSETWDSRILNL